MKLFFPLLIFLASPLFSQNENAQIAAVNLPNIAGVISSPSEQHLQTLDGMETKRIHLPNGWGITPVGKSLPLGDLPLNIAVSPSGKMLADTGGDLLRTLR